jgi:sugar phosphate isomerase/epimerase
MPSDTVSGSGRLRLGLSSGALYPHVASEDAPTVAARLGLVDLEVMLQTPGEYEGAVIRALRINAAAAGVHVHSLHTWQDLHRVLDPYPRRAREGVERFRRALAAAVEVEATALVWHGPTRRDVQVADGWERFLAITAELATECAAAGVRLAIENVSWGALPDVRAVTSFVARLPEIDPGGAIGFTFDPFQAAEAGANPFMILAAMGDRVVDVHLSDHREGDPAARHLPPGDGDLPWPALLRAIAGVYAGPLMVEASLGPAGEGFGRVKARLQPLIDTVAVGYDPAARCQGLPPPGVLEGIRLFNDRQFYECHEAIEHEWHAERGEIRLLYQGILQIGVGFHHARNGNHRGAVLLLTDGIAKTNRFLPRCLGIETGRLVAESQACLDRIMALGPGRLGEFDVDEAPLVHLGGDRSAPPRR